MFVRENSLTDPTVNCGEFGAVKTLEFEEIGTERRINTVEFTGAGNIRGIQ